LGPVLLGGVTAQMTSMPGAVRRCTRIKATLGPVLLGGVTAQMTSMPGAVRRCTRIKTTLGPVLLGGVTAQMTSMPGAVRRCTRILWHGKASGKTLKGVSTPFCVKVAPFSYSLCVS
jgi:hypothetical protein